MKLARVVGTVVLNQCIPPYRGRILHLTRALDQRLEPVGDPEVSASWLAMQEGDDVIVEVSREACNAFDPPIAVDSVIIAKVDKVLIDARFGGQQ
jgi:microcompartment protein CcmK/EutM